MTAICVERGTFSDKEWKREAEGAEDEETAESEPLFSIGQKVENVLYGPKIVTFFQNSSRIFA